jgi:UDP-3-O-[3-hydroxymyristoyl] glucosamine N-acyltransferase
MSNYTYTLAKLAELLEGEVHGDATVVVSALAPLSDARAGQLSFLANPKYTDQVAMTQASAVLLTKEALPLCQTNAIVLANPYLAFAKVASLFDKTPKPKAGIHPSAVIDETAKIDATASIAANVVIGAYTVVGADVEIGANTVISDYCHLSDNVKIKTNVSIYHDVKMGKNTIIHANSVIGSDGFGNAKDHQGNWLKIPQLGGVVIGAGVEIGACTSIDRGAIADTIIHDGVKIDNQVQIGHNVEVGKNTAMAAQTGIAGSVKIGENCLFGGQAGISGHIEIADQVMIGPKSGVMSSITEPGVYSSIIPAKGHMQWKRILARMYNLDKLTNRVKTLEKKVSE